MKKAIVLWIMALAVFGFATAASAQVAKKPYAVVSLTFDDAPRSVYTQAYPLLNAARLPATVYVSTAFVGLSGYLKWTDIKALDAGGWEIGAHTHAHLDLTTMPPDGVVEEIAKSQALLRERGFKAVSFSAPYGAYSERELVELKKVYSSNRAAWGNGGVNDYHRRDTYNLASLGVTLDTTVDEIRKQIQTIKQNGGWLILQFHQIDNGQDEPTAFAKDSPYTTKRFPEIIKVILEEQVPVRTVRDIIENP